MDPATDHQPAPLSADEALSLVLAEGIEGRRRAAGIVYPLPDGTSLVIDDDAPHAGDRPGFEDRVLAILSAHDLAGIEDGDGEEYRAEAGEVAARMALAPAWVSDPDQVATMLAAVLTRWFSSEDGAAALTFEPDACRDAARDLVAAYQGAVEPAAGA